jgi:hypothetical protein
VTAATGKFTRTTIIPTLSYSNRIHDLVKFLVLLA